MSSGDANDAADDSSSTLHHLEELQDRQRLADLARTYSQHSTHPAARDQAVYRKDSADLDASKIDPDSSNFDLPTFLRQLLATLDNNNINIRSSDVCIKDLNVYGSGSSLSLQATVADAFAAPFRLRDAFRKQDHKHILHDINVNLHDGELLVVLGRPGAGCSTFLKAMTGELHGLMLDDQSEITYSGIPQSRMMREFKGEAVYNQEVDKHFPHLTVGETLEHAASLRVPQNRPDNMSRPEFIKHITRVVMAIYGLSHTYNTKVGNDFVRGVSGGERKRVSIAEMALACSPISAWDNSSRGLDSAAALQFVKSLRLSCSLLRCTSAVAIYQASQAMYDLFDKTLVLYEGRQIYFGPASKAKAYFEDMGWECPDRQTTGDFITSVTNPTERIARSGWEHKVPRSPEEFETYWQKSKEYTTLMTKLETDAEGRSENSTTALKQFRADKNERQANRVRPKSPYLVSIPMQIKYNFKRAYRRTVNDPVAVLTQVTTNMIMALIIGSCFYNTPQGTQGFNSFGGVMFFAILLSALAAVSEVSILYSQRPMIEKHKSYAFYHPWTEAMASMVLDMPIKLLSSTAFALITYFLAHLRRTPSAFFLFLLVNFIITIIMAAVFRTMAALTRTISEAMAISGVLILAIVVYTGYTIPVPYMHPWLSWIRYLNPVQYGFEMLVANQFHGVDWTCSSVVPAYSPQVGASWVCSTVGAIAGQSFVSGDAFIESAYGYSWSHFWRNFGILCAFLIAFLACYFAAVEWNSSTTATAEALVFRRGHVPAYLRNANKKAPGSDDETSEKAAEATVGHPQNGALDAIPAQQDIFTWRNVVLDITIKNEPRRLLDNISGWVKPGTLTALMGSSGAGKTTLLDALAQRTTVGVISGDLFVSGKPLDASFARKTGYVQQQDLHLQTATVRESLRFSAMLRQPASVSKQEKLDYVEDVIRMLGMEDFAEAVVGVPGEGLNVEQRKLLTIGVELAAKPKLLLFLDEPTSGLDSQSSWAICAFLRRLADAGQAVLCTIHQPSAILFQQFDRLLFLQKGGQTVYFGDIGKSSRTLTDYFERNGARSCGSAENPAEYMLEMVTNGQQNWHDVWKASPEFPSMEQELHHLQHQTSHASETTSDESHEHSEFAMPFLSQLYHVQLRVFQQYWRTPSYILAKWALCTASGLFIGFSFYAAPTSQQGMQNVLFSLFLVGSLFVSIVNQILPMFVIQRDLYEVRERPSRAYSWKAFVIAQIIAEIPYQVVSGLLIYACFYYPVAGIASSERQGLVLLYCVALFVYASTFGQMCIAALPDEATASAVMILLFSMSLTFCGVLQAPSALPGFWTFMYRASFFTYWVGGMTSSMLWGREVICAANELNVFDPPTGQTCGQYLTGYLNFAPGTLQNPLATSGCNYCPLSSSNTFLSSVNIEWDDRWRNFGLLWVYIVFNVAATIGLYWFFRARKMSTKQKK